MRMVDMSPCVRAPSTPPIHRTMTILLAPLRRVSDWPQDVPTRPALSRDAVRRAQNVLAQFVQMAGADDGARRPRAVA